MDVYYQTEGIEQAVHVARYAPVVDEFPVVDFVDELWRKTGETLTSWRNDRCSGAARALLERSLSENEEKHRDHAAGLTLSGSVFGHAALLVALNHFQHLRRHPVGRLRRIKIYYANFSIARCIVEAGVTVAFPLSSAESVPRFPLPPPLSVSLESKGLTPADT